MPVATTTALLIGAGVAAVGTAASVRQGQISQGLQHRSQVMTKMAQDEALRQQMIERQRSVQAEMEANRPTPASSVMDAALGAATDKTGGVDDRLRLSKSTKLGGGT